MTRANTKNGMNGEMGADEGPCGAACLTQVIARANDDLHRLDVEIASRQAAVSAHDAAVVERDAVLRARAEAAAAKIARESEELASTPRSR